MNSQNNEDSRLKEAAEQATRAAEQAKQASVSADKASEEAGEAANIVREVVEDGGSGFGVEPTGQPSSEGTVQPAEPTENMPGESSITRPDY